MKHLNTLFFSLTSLLFLVCSPVNVQAQQKVPLAVQTITYAQHTFDVCVVDLNQHQIDLHLEKKDGRKYRSISKLLQNLHDQDNKPLMITNAGMYLPHKDNEPQGLYVSNGIERDPLNLRDTTVFLNFYLKPNGVFLLTDDGGMVVESEKYPAVAAQKKVRLATQSGPMLVIDGQLHPKFNADSKSTYIRSGVGVLPNGQLAFVISNERVNFYTFAKVFQEILACKNALYLDGAISKMYLPQLKRFDLGGNFGGMLSVSPK
ncbi:MAG: phosphodiester glycosidase family protein [Chitinophagales bacterium]